MPYALTLCTGALAIAVGLWFPGWALAQCPVFKVCPGKGIIGDYKRDAPPPAELKKKQ